jgi:hypothetical protein
MLQSQCPQQALLVVLEVKEALVDLEVVVVEETAEIAGIAVLVLVVELEEMVVRVPKVRMVLQELLIKCMHLVQDNHLLQ